MKRLSVCGALVTALVSAGVPALAQDVDAGQKKAEACVACHGPNGNPTQPQYPMLAGQTARYIYLQLRDFKEGRRRHDGALPTEPEMELEPFVKDLSRQDMFDLSAFFAAQKPRRPAFKVDPAKAARGKAKAAETLCTMCHLGGFMGQNEIPRVAGQQYSYVVKQLKDFKTGRRTNDAGNMVSVSRTLNDEDIDNLGHYLADL